MVLEYAEGGTLYDKIKFGYGQLPKEKVKKYFKDVCKAVDYLHTLNYMHRDIKVPYILYKAIKYFAHKRRSCKIM